MVQLFDAAAHMPDNLDPRVASSARCREVAPLFVKLSFPRALSAGIVKSDPNANLRSVDPSIGKSVSHGKAWAARRDIIEACGHFDKAIVGGGDTVHIQASRDMLDEEYLVKYDLPRGYRAAAHAWAKTARRIGLFQSVSSLDRHAYHLWHGEIADRGYLSRLEFSVGTTTTRIVTFVWRTTELGRGPIRRARSPQMSKPISPPEFEDGRV